MTGERDTDDGERPDEGTSDERPERESDTGEQAGEEATPVGGLRRRFSEAWEDDDQSLVDRGRLRRLVTYVLVLSVVVSLMGVVYVAVTADQRSDPFTEFYVVGPTGNASGYPTNLTTGETGEFIVGIQNHEHQSQEYTVVLVLNGTRYDSRSTVVADGETWEERVSVTATQPGRHELQILLYRGSDASISKEPYRLTQLSIGVSTPQGNRSRSVVDRANDGLSGPADVILPRDPAAARWNSGD